MLPHVVSSRNYSIHCSSAATYRGCLCWLRQRLHWCSGCRRGTLRRPGGSSSLEPGVVPVRRHPAGFPSAEPGGAPAASDKQTKDVISGEELKLTLPSSNQNLLTRGAIRNVQEAAKIPAQIQKKKKRRKSKFDLSSQEDSTAGRPNILSSVVEYTCLPTAQLQSCSHSHLLYIDAFNAFL